MQWKDEWRYAKRNRKLRIALKKLERQLWGILLNPDKLLSRRNFCTENRIEECPFRFKYSDRVIINFCLAPSKVPLDQFHRQLRDIDCFILPYCRRGNVRAMNEKAWKRRARIG